MGGFSKPLGSCRMILCRLPAGAPALLPCFVGCPEAGRAGGPGEGDPGGSTPSSLVPFPCSIQRLQAAISLRPGKTSPFVWRAGRGWAAKGLRVPSRPPSRRGLPEGGTWASWRGVLPAAGCQKPRWAWKVTRALPGKEASPRLIAPLAIKAGRARDLPAGSHCCPPSAPGWD